MPVELDLVVHIVTPANISQDAFATMERQALLLRSADAAMAAQIVFLEIVTSSLKSVNNLNLFA